METGLPATVASELWRIPFGGRSTPVVFDGRVFAINLAGQGVDEQERVFAADLATGKILWEHRFNVFHTDVPNTRVGWASVTVDPETGNVYANGVQGMFLCLSREGQVIWSKSLTELFGRISGYGGRTHTPLIDEDRVIISFNNSSFGSHALGAQRYLAMDKRTGEILWWATPGGRPEDTTYSNPVVAVIDGQRLIIGGNADGGVYAIQARTGEKVWGFRLSQRGINSSVVVDGYRVYATHSEENHDSTEMGRVVCIDGRGSGDITKTHELWRCDGCDAGYASPLLHAGRLYVMSNSGILSCFDSVSGKQIWTFGAGRIGKGSPVWADSKIYVTTANGDFVILQDAGQECRLLDKVTYEMGREGNVELFGSPAVADGRVVFFTTTDMICLGSKDAQRRPVAIPTLPAEGTADATPATVLVRPAEVLLTPGQSVKFQAGLYDKQGRFIKNAEAQWSYRGQGDTLSGDGQFTAGPQGSVGEVVAQVNTLQGTARVRVAAELPLAEDFDSYGDGDVVGWWVGVSKTKYAVDTQDGSKVLKKLSDDRGPIFNRSHAFITPPLPAGYTIEADVKAPEERRRRRGDAGLVNDRYVLELFGGSQRARVMSWIPGPRFEKRVDFTWEPNVWYRLKLRVDVAGDEARVLAKIWRRDEAEPAPWTIEAVDPQPNREGSAGLYANSTMGPVYFDNVKVYRHSGG